MVEGFHGFGGQDGLLGYRRSAPVKCMGDIDGYGKSASPCPSDT